MYSQKSENIKEARRELVHQERLGLNDTIIVTEL